MNRVFETGEEYKALTDEQLSDIFSDVRFHTPPMRHQLASLIFGLDGRERVMLWHGVGTGKTLTALYLFQLWECKKGLVISPNSVISTWVEQAAEHAPELKVVTLTGTRAEREAALREQADLYVINYEGLKTLWGHKVPVRTKKGQPSKLKYVPDLGAIEKTNFDCLIGDEIHRFKSPMALQTNIARQLSARADKAIMLTGTPIAKSELDMWAEYAVLDCGDSLGNSYWAYRAKHFREGFYVWNIKEGGRDKIMSAVAPNTLHYMREECIDLPEKTYEKRRIEPSTEQARLAAEIYEELKASIETGEVQVASVLHRAQKALQVYSGFILDERKQPHRLKDNPKLKELSRCLDEIGGKCIIFHTFIEEGRMIEELCRKAKLGYASLRGEIKDKDTEYHKFKNDPETRVLVAHPASGGEGLNLFEAHVCIFFSPLPSVITREQAEGRIYRKGQTQNCLYIDLLMHGSIEENMYYALKGRRNLAAEVMEWLRR